MKHDFLRRLSALALALVMAASLCATPAWAADAFTVTLNKTTLQLTVGGEETLTPSVSLSTGFTSNWESSKPNVATVDNNGKVTALAPGETVITYSVTTIVNPPDTATTEKATCTVTVTAADPAVTKPEDVKLDAALIVLTDHNTRTLSIDATLPANAEITWRASGDVTLNDDKTTVTGTATSVIVGYKANVDRVSNQTVTADIKVNGVYYCGQLECRVYANDVPLDFSNVQAQLDNLTVDEERELVIRITDNAKLFEDGDVTFTSSLPGVASVEKVEKTNSGFKVTLKGLTVGNTWITMRVLGSYTKEWLLNVGPKPNTTPVEFVILKGTTALTLTAGASHNLEVEIVPSYATNKTINWSSSNPGVATVDENGKVTAVKAGTAVITAEAVNGIENCQPATCTVTVKDSASALELKPTSLYLNLDYSNQRSGTIQAIPSGENSATAVVTWKSSNTSVATVSGSGLYGREAKVTAGTRTGTATITATATFTDQNNRKTTRTATCSVTVVDKNSVTVTGLTLSESSHKMPEDGKFKLSVTSVTPSNAPIKTVKWHSSNENVATVDGSGNVTAKGPGEAIVYAAADFGGGRGICQVKVTPKTESIRLAFNYNSNSPLGSNNYTYIFGKGNNDYVTVKAVLSCDDKQHTPEDPVHWSSSNESVATVSSGTGLQASVRAVGPGKTTITAAPMDAAGKDRAAVTPAKIEVTVSGLAVKKDDAAVTTLTMQENRRETLTAELYGSANNGDPAVDWTSSDPAIVSVGQKNGVSTILTARKAGSAVITATKGSYTATCTVTVGEDASGLITLTGNHPAGSPVNMATAKATSDSGSGTLAQVLGYACSAKTGASLSYVTGLAVASTDQGILHDQHQSSESTGAGVGATDIYYVNANTAQGQRPLSDLSFVPRTTFTGEAEISYTGRATNNQTFSGTIRLTVNGTGDVMYSSSGGSVVNFLSDDFNFYHANLKSVSFTLPLDSAGTLYYNYTSASQPGTKVTSGTSYNRTGNPSLDKVSFVPNAGYEGTVKISYKGTDTSNRAFTGVVTITVSKGSGAGANPADISYALKEDGWVTFLPADFSRACQQTLGESLSYVRFTLPSSSEGTLFYNYRGFSNYDGAVASTTSYYYSGTPALSGVSFVPTTTTPGQVDIGYTGYSVRGNTFTGTIHIGQDSGAQEEQGGMRYTVFTGKSVSLSANSFNAACTAATGASLNYVTFNQLPAVGQGTLRYTRGNSSGYTSVTTSTRCYRASSNSWDTLIGNVSFLANASYTGTVTIPFTGYNTNGASFTGEVIIEVTPPTSGDITFTGTTASPFRLSASQVRSACSGVLDGTLSYITFTSLPSATAGRLYSGYNGAGTGSQVYTGTRYYASGSPSIDQLSFVPRGRYTGQVTVGYTATNTSGQSVTGRIVFNLSSSGSSSYFSDMIYHTWAAPAVDYLYQNGVTKGVTPTTFGPNQQILRCDFVLMLCRAFKLSGGSGYSFADVPTDAYFAQAVATAKQLGVVNGDGGNFKPYSPLTRQDAMVMIQNALKAAGRGVSSSSTSVLNSFSDGSTVSSYARDAVSTLVQMGAVNGDEGRLLPHNSITRAEAAIILHFVMTM